MTRYERTFSGYWFLGLGVAMAGDALGNHGIAWVVLLLFSMVLLAVGAHLLASADRNPTERRDP